jgi:hypothetical protein
LGVVYHRSPTHTATGFRIGTKPKKTLQLETSKKTLSERLFLPSRGVEGASLCFRYENFKQYIVYQ